jgi:hypothetical protein
LNAQLEQPCETCQQILTYTGRDRLSDCGHMKRSGGGWILRNAQAILPLSGQITEQQASEIKRLSQDIADATVAARDANTRVSKASAALETYLDGLKARGA